MKENKYYQKVLVILFFCLLIFMGNQKVWAGEKSITEFSKIFYIPAGAMEKGTGFEGLREIYDTMRCTAYTEKGEKLSLDVIWDYSGICTWKKGAYQIFGTVKLPEGYTSQVALPVWFARISVQDPDLPELYAYSRMISAGLYYFPWIIRTDPSRMEIWMKEEGQGWVNVSEEGYGMCDTDGLYLSSQSMLPGKIYTLTVSYEGGKTDNLKYRYGSDGNLDVISYTPGAVGELLQKETVIRSIEPVEKGGLERCMAYAIRTGQSLSEIRKDLEDTIYIQGSTQNCYEDTAAHPSVVLKSVWDFSSVDIHTPGVYKVKAGFSAPEGYTLDPKLEFPFTTAYIAVQKPDQPQIQTYYMADADTFFFPMVLDAFEDSQLEEFQVYLEGEDRTCLLTQENATVGRKGLYLRKNVLKLGRDYRLYAIYPGGSTGIYEFHYDETFLTHEHWYERNYADRDGNNLPDLDNGTEKVTDTSTVIVGNRLLDMLEIYKKNIPFEKDGVQVKVPVEVVKKWEVSSEDEIKINISKDQDQISVHLYKNREELTDISGGSLELPSGYTGETVLEDEEGNIYSGTKKEEQNITEIKIDKTGDFTIEETEDPEKESSEKNTGEMNQAGESRDSSKGEEKTDGESSGNRKPSRVKSAALVAGTAFLSILLLYLPGRNEEKLRKGERGESKKRK